MTVETPAVAPAVTTPDEAPIVATVGRLLDQVTGATTEVRSAVVLAHIDVGPVIVGIGLIITVRLPVIDKEQPVTGFVAITVYVPARVSVPSNSRTCTGNYANSSYTGTIVA